MAFLSHKHVFRVFLLCELKVIVYRPAGNKNFFLPAMVSSGQKKFSFARSGEQRAKKVLFCPLRRSSGQKKSFLPAAHKLCFL